MTVPAATTDRGFWRSHCSLLVSLGYDTVPIKPGSKSPGIKGWVERDFSKANPRAHSGYGVGVKTGRPNADGYAVIAVDIDVLDADVADRVVAWCRETIGVAPARIGRRPKVLLPYRTSGPLRSKRSCTYRSPDGVEHAVEVLGQKRQFLAYAIHPDTGQPYIWPGRELVSTPIAELPEITEQQVFDFIDYFESNVPTDWEVIARESARAVAEAHLPGKNQRAPIWKLRFAMEAVPIEPETYNRWLRIGMALHHATDGSAEGFELWDQWSRKGRKYDGSTSAKWSSFR